MMTPSRMQSKMVLSAAHSSGVVKTLLPRSLEAASSEDEFDKDTEGNFASATKRFKTKKCRLRLLKLKQLRGIYLNLSKKSLSIRRKFAGFLNYYLPTTLKLLNFTHIFERQGIEGENIRAGKKNIEEILDMLIKGYEHQLDRLFEADTLSVESDISVLEQMLRRDGFYDDDFCIGKDNPFEVNNFSDKGYTDDISDSIGGGTAVAKSHEEEHKDEQQPPRVSYITFGVLILALYHLIVLCVMRLQIYGFLLYKICLSEV